MSGALHLQAYLSTLSDEEKALRLQHGREKAQQNREEGYALYKQDWLDEAHWQHLARKYNVRLPMSHKPPKAYYIAKTAKQLGLTNWELAFYGIHSGHQKEIDKINDKIPSGSKYGMRAYIGWLLELKDTWKE